MDYSSELKSWCNKTIELMEWNLEKDTSDFKEKGSRRITADEDLKKMTYKALYEADINAGRGISSLYRRINRSDNYSANWVDFFGMRSTASFDPEIIEEQRVLAYHIRSLIDMYEYWEENGFRQKIESIANTNNFDLDGVEKINPDILESINNLVNKNTFGIYKYTDTGETINANDSFFISSLVGFSADLTLWLNHVRNQNEFLEKQSSNEVFVTMFGKIDEVSPIYSSWIITLHKKGTTWIVSDQIDFDNPYQKHARLGRKSVWRDYDEKYYECDLPYDLFLDLDSLRAENKGLVSADRMENIEVDFDKKSFSSFDFNEKHDYYLSEFKNCLNKNNIDYGVAFVNIGGSDLFREIESIEAKLNGRTIAVWSFKSDLIIVYKTPEILFKDFKTLSLPQKVFTILLTNELLMFASSDGFETPMVLLANDFVEQKLLEGAKIDPTSKDTKMSYWIDSAKKIFEELIETVDEDEEESTALTVKSYDLVKLSNKYNSSWLTTADRLQSLSEWIILDGEADKISANINKLRGLEDEGEKWLMETLNNNYSKILKKISYSERYEFIAKNSFGFGFNTESGDKVSGSIIHLNKKKKSVEDKRGSGIGKTKYYEESCLNCDNFNSKEVVQLNIEHYKELMWLLDFNDRNELHKYYRNYRRHNHIPYSGNSILDQTHPYLRLKDPASRTNPNGFTIRFYICGHCWRKIKKNFKKTKVTIKYDNI